MLPTTAAANDNHPPRPAFMVPIVGHVGDGGRVLIVDPAWREALAAFPNDHREP